MIQGQRSGLGLRWRSRKKTRRGTNVLGVVDLEAKSQKSSFEKIQFSSRAINGSFIKSEDPNGSRCFQERKDWSVAQKSGEGFLCPMNSV